MDSQPTGTRYFWDSIRVFRDALGLLGSALAFSCGGEPVHSALSAPAASAAVASPPAESATPTRVTPSVTRRVVVSLSRVSGSDVASVAPDGTVTIALDVQENGRGPHTDATVRFAADGTLTELSASGHHEMGTPVAEMFRQTASHAVWRGREETGERDLQHSSFFVPLAELPDALGWLVQALLRAGGTLPLLPAGQARLEKTGETTVRVGNSERRLVGYAIYGLDLLPTRVWMNEDGSWFGIVSPWWSVVPEGFESVIDGLIEKQNQLDRERDQTLAQQLRHAPPAAGLAFTHGRVLDVEHGRYLADQTVLVVGDAIRAIGPSSKLQIPAGVEVVDVAGKAVLPGLWDMHAHLSDASGVLYTAAGVTTARDVGNDPDKLDDWKRRYDEGSAIGPHVLRFGFIEGRGEKAASSKVTAETPSEAQAAVDFYQKRGYDGIKIYNSVKPELVPLIAREAHARGMSVTGHIPVHMLANEAVRAGYDGIEHVNMLFLNFFADHQTDTRTTLRFSLVGDRAASLDLESAPVRDFIRLLQQHHTIIDPTLGIFEELLCAEQGKLLPDRAAFAGRLPVQAERWFLRGGLPMDGDKSKVYAASFEKMLALVKALHDAQVPVVAGTDDFAGWFVHLELELFVRAGLSPADALRAATIEPARLMKQDKRSGSIAVGKAADLFIVDGDPLTKIMDVDNVVQTLRGGLLYASTPLYESVGVRPYEQP